MAVGNQRKPGRFQPARNRIQSQCPSQCSRSQRAAQWRRRTAGFRAYECGEDGVQGTVWTKRRQSQVEIVVVNGTDIRLRLFYVLPRDLLLAPRFVIECVDTF